MGSVKMNYYFSEREGITQSQTEENISLNFWRGFSSYIDSRIYDGSFAQKFPVNCYDSPIVIGTDSKSLMLALKAEFKTYKIPFQDNHQPNGLEVIDLIEFFYKYISKPIFKEYHDFFKHYHILGFDSEEGQKDYLEYINRLFRRNNLAYELKKNGEVIRLIPTELKYIISKIDFTSEDDLLNNLIEDACTKFLNPDIKIRKEGLDKLWDSWERLKTIESGRDKKEKVEKLLERAIESEELREYINKEALVLTEIGNNFTIRHTEKDKIPLNKGEYIDYLFYRLFLLLRLLLILTNRAEIIGN